MFLDLSTKSVDIFFRHRKCFRPKNILGEQKFSRWRSKNVRRFFLDHRFFLVLPETMFFIEDNDFSGNRDFSIYNGSYMIFRTSILVPGINGENRILEKSRMRISPRFIGRSCWKLQGTNRMSCSSQILNIKRIGAVFKYKRAI